MKTLMKIFLLAFAVHAVFGGNCKSDPDDCPNGKRCEDVCNPPGKNCKEQCVKFTCLENEFECTRKKQCVSYRKRCDGENDCDDESDEENCPFMCPRGTFTCLETDHCVPTELICDGFSDCGVNDTSDETNCNLCQSHWRSVLSLNGIMPVTGSKDDLKAEVLSGSEIKVNLPHFFEYVTIQNVRLQDGEVVAQTLLPLTAANKVRLNLNDGTFSHFFLEMSSSGIVSFRLFSLKGRTLQDIASFPFPMTFYARSAGRVTDLDFVAHQVQHGAYLKVLKDNFHFFPLDVVKTDGNTFEGVSLFEKEEEEPVTKVAARVLRLFSSNNSVITTKHEYPQANISKSIEETSSLKWFVDPCYRPVYAQDDSGEHISGSLDDLINFIKNGHRVIVSFENQFIRATTLRINGNDVTAQLYFVDSSNRTVFQTDTEITWCDVDTAATKTCVKEGIMDDQRRGSPTFDSVALTWYVEIRPWVNIFNNNLPDKNDTFSAALCKIKRGSDLRYEVERLDANGFPYQTYYESIHTDFTDSVFSATNSLEQDRNFVTNAVDGKIYTRATSEGEFHIRNPLNMRNDVITTPIRWFFAD